jgi:2-polyprenyl-6-methoxyphenol hydroxylase-like FAD-dependent oxidoreductase
MLALLLGRRGVPVTLLEAHHDFDRQFRGDTLHPAILEILDQLGLAEALLRLPHVRWYGPTILAANGPFIPFDFRRLHTRFPYIVVMPQERFLGFLVEQARQHPHFRLVLGANVQRLIEEKGAVRGVRYQGADGWHEVRATLTVAADGRFSRLRHLAGLTPIALSGPLELLWFRLPRLPGDEVEFDTLVGALRSEPFMVLRGALVTGSASSQERVVAIAHAGGGHIMPVFNYLDRWQVGLFYPPGQYQRLRAAGLEALREVVTALEPRLARHVQTLTDWHQLSPLSVAFSRCRRWYRPGLLLIGDAAHVMTPAAGAGIKYAIEDAVVVANVLAGRLLAGRVRLQDLAEVQRRRQWPTRLIQAAGALAQRTILPVAFRAAGKDRLRPRIPWLARLLLGLPLLRVLPARLAAFGPWKVRVEG